MGWWLGSPVQDKIGFLVAITTYEFPLFVLIREFQPTCLALRSPDTKPGNSAPKQAVRTSPISGREGLL